jgi:hypothetical protein
MARQSAQGLIREAIERGEYFLAVHEEWRAFSSAMARVRKGIADGGVDPDHYLKEGGGLIEEHVSNRLANKSGSNWGCDPRFALRMTKEREHRLKGLLMDLEGDLRSRENPNAAPFVRQ